MNRNDLIDILTVIQVIDHRTIGEADIIAWGDLIGDLPKDLALQAVRDHRREQPGVWLEPGHVYARVRAIRQDLFMRQPVEQIEARNDAMDARLATVIAELAETAAIPDETPNDIVWHPTPRSPLMVRCPWCHASAGQRCFIPGTRQLFRGYHPARHDAAQATAPATTATPLCSVCGAHALQAIHETARGICDGCWPSTNGHQQRNDERGTGS